MRKMLILLFAFIYIAAYKADAQVTIAPPLVVMDRENPYGSYLVVNRSNQAQEITISFKYGFPVSDDEGNVTMEYFDEPDSLHPSASEWIRAFPRRFVLEPMQEQTVRLMVRPRGSVPDGTYTARIVTSSIKINPSDNRSMQENGVSTNINFRFNQISALMYRHGEVTTEIEIKDITAKETEQGINVFASLHRGGNSPYLGTARVRLFENDNNLVDEKVQSVAVYEDIVRRFEFDREKVQQGEYTAELTLSTSGRSDISSSVLIKVPDVTKSLSFSIQ